MSFKDVMKSVGKSAANSFLDDYARCANKTGHPESAEGTKILKDFINGKVDYQGNPIKNDYHDDDY